MSSPDGPGPEPTQTTAQAQAERSSLAGISCLATLLLGGAVGGSAAVFLGIARIVQGTSEELADTTAARALALSLEGAVVLIAFGALGILLAGVAALLLFKELSDAVARRRRGPV